MKERDRLIRLIMKANSPLISLARAEELADYLLDNGVIVPPCELHQQMWQIAGFEVEECRVSSLTLKADGSFKIRLTYLKYRSVFEITADTIGKTVFPTREEAEKALAGRGHTE